jgi:hypoxanthine phosphoribosyltransferase
VEGTENLELLYSKYDIKDKIKHIAGKIQLNYIDNDKTPCIIPVLTGAMMFTSDLIRNLQLPKLKLYPVQVKSYNGMENTGNIVMRLDVDKEKVKDKDLIIVEDIIDSGRTIRFLLDEFAKKEPRSIAVCTLLDKPDARIVQVPIDYCGFKVPNKWIVGYGIDYNDMHRGKYGIYIMEEPNNRANQNPAALR